MTQTASQSGAKIIQFPKRPGHVEPSAEQVIAAFAAPATEDPALRLRRALDMLDSALAEQRAAVADWRGAIADLNGSVKGLGSSLSTYQSALATLKDRVTPKA
jgi:hypothetical protein